MDDPTSRCRSRDRGASSRATRSSCGLRGRAHRRQRPRRSRGLRHRARRRGGADFTANLRAPIIIAGGRGFQVINEADDAPVRAPLFAQLVGDAAAGSLSAPSCGDPRRKPMLIITRQTGEQIIIGDEVALEVMEVSGPSARIGIEHRGRFRSTARRSGRPCAQRTPQPRSADRALSRRAGAAAAAAGRASVQRGLAEHGPLGGLRARADESRTSASRLAQRREHVAGHEIGIGRVRPPDAGPNAGEVPPAELSASPTSARCGRPARRRARADLAERQVDLVVDDEHAVEVEPAAPRAGPTERPARS